MPGVESGTGQRASSCLCPLENIPGIRGHGEHLKGWRQTRSLCRFGISKIVIKIMTSPVLWVLRSPQSLTAAERLCGEEEGTHLMKVCQVIVLSLFFRQKSVFWTTKRVFFLSRRKPTPALLPLLFPLPTPAFKHSTSPKQSCGCGVGGCVLGLTPSTLPSKLPLLHITLEERNSTKTMQKLEFFAIF